MRRGRRTTRSRPASRRGSSRRGSGAPTPSTPDGEGPGFGYEALNLVDGRRSVGEIRDDLAATVGDAPIEEVAEYLETLVRLGVLAV